MVLSMKENNIIQKIQFNYYTNVSFTKMKNGSMKNIILLKVIRKQFISIQFWFNNNRNIMKKNESEMIVNLKCIVVKKKITWQKVSKTQNSK